MEPGSWKQNMAVFPQHPDWSHNSWRALPESSTIITGTALTAGFPQLLTFQVGKCCVCVCVAGGVGVSVLCTAGCLAAFLDSIHQRPQAYSPSPSFDSQKCLLEGKSPLAENSWFIGTSLSGGQRSRSFVPWCHTCAHGDTILLNSINSGPGTATSYPREN